MSTHTATKPKMGPRHRTRTPDSRRKLAFRWFITFRWHLLALFLSQLGRSMITRKYDAFTTDNAYSASPSGKGLSRLVDWIVRHRDTHVALRQRLDIVTSELTEATLAKRESGAVRLVSGPVGLGRDMRQTWRRLESLGTNPEQWLEPVGVDIDASGTVLGEASLQAAAAGIPLQTYQHDLLDPDGITRSIGGTVDVFNTIGLSTWLDAESLDRLLQSISEALSPGGTLIIDHWRLHSGSKYVGTLQMPARYVADEVFEETLRRAGFEIDQKRVTPNGVVVVYRVSKDTRAG